MKKIQHLDYAAHIVRAIPKGVLLTTKADKVNSMVIGWGTYGVEWGKPMVVVYLREGRYTRSQLDAHPEFTVNFPLEGQTIDSTILDVCGMHSGYTLDNVEKAGLTLVSGGETDVPGILEAPLTLECRVVFRQKQELELIHPDFRTSYPQDVPGTAPLANRDAHIAYYGEIVGAYLAE